MINSRGYTLLELTLVLLLVGLGGALVWPNLVMVDGLSIASRQLIGLTRSAAVSAVTHKQIHRINFDFSENSSWVSVIAQNEEKPPSDPDIRSPLKLPTGVTYQNVKTLGYVRSDQGRPFVQFYPSGRADGAIIHITDGKDLIALEINPITAHVRIRANMNESTRGSDLPDQVQGLFVPSWRDRR